MKKKIQKTMRVIGLTGSVGMGKSKAAEILKSFGLPVYDADQAVHRLLAKKGKAVKPVAKVFPLALRKGVIDRHILGAMVFERPKELKRLEAILHPLVRKEEKFFLKAAKRRKAPAAVLEIPLLFETGGEARCDVTFCVTAPLKIQKARVLDRKGMTETKFKAILKRQMPDREKRRRADFVIHTGRGLDDTKKQLVRILKRLGSLS